MSVKPQRTSSTVIEDLKWRKEWIPAWRGTWRDIPPSRRPKGQKNGPPKKKQYPRRRVKQPTVKRPVLADLPDRKCEDCGETYAPTGKYGKYCYWCRVKRWKAGADKREQRRGIDRK